MDDARLLRQRNELHTDRLRDARVAAPRRKLPNGVFGEGAVHVRGDTYGCEELDGRSDGAASAALARRLHLHRPEAALTTRSTRAVLPRTTYIVGLCFECDDDNPFLSQRLLNMPRLSAKGLALYPALTTIWRSMAHL